MKQMGSLSEIIILRKHLDDLKRKGLVADWGVSYENIQRRHTAADFFLTPGDESKLEQIWSELGQHKILQRLDNGEQGMARKQWRVEFNSGISL